MDAFVINLSAAKERWDHIEKIFAPTAFSLVRVEAVDGNALTAGVAGYSERSFFRRHGRTTNLREVACYHSHIRAMRLFLASGEEHALICEDDIALETDPAQIVKRLLDHAGSWDIARLSGLREAKGVNAIALQPGYFLRVNFGRLKGAGAYLLNRRAAQTITEQLLPMRVPFDHAIDREWVYGLNAVSVSPFPIDQIGVGFRTSIQRGPARKLSTFRRLCFTYPYQALNEVSRWLFRIPRALALCRRPPSRAAGGAIDPVGG